MVHMGLVYIFLIAALASVQDVACFLIGVTAMIAGTALGFAANSKDSGQNKENQESDGSHAPSQFEVVIIEVRLTAIAVDKRTGG